MHINRFQYLQKQRPNMFLFFPWMLLNKIEYCSHQQAWIVIIFLVKTLKSASAVTLLWRPQSLDISYSIKNVKHLLLLERCFSCYLGNIYREIPKPVALWVPVLISILVCFLVISNLLVCEYFYNANITLQINIV